MEYSDAVFLDPEPRNRERGYDPGEKEERKNEVPLEGDPHVVGVRPQTDVGEDDDARHRHERHPEPETVMEQEREPGEEGERGAVEPGDQDDTGPSAQPSGE